MARLFFWPLSYKIKLKNLPPPREVRGKEKAATTKTIRCGTRRMREDELRFGVIHGDAA
jgi:hypothetical protein